MICGPFSFREEGTESHSAHTALPEASHLYLLLVQVLSLCEGVQGTRKQLTVALKQEESQVWPEDQTALMKVRRKDNDGHLRLMDQGQSNQSPQSLLAAGAGIQKGATSPCILRQLCALALY